MTGLILASTSETRCRMLEAAGVPFTAEASAADEEAGKAALLRRGAHASEIAEGLAELKALSLDREALVLGSDQVLEREDGSVLSKAGSREEAKTQLRALSGKTHVLYSAAALALGGKIVWRATESVQLQMRALSDAFLARYLDDEYAQVRYNVGVYRIEGPGVQLFDQISGSHFAILGMPLLPLLAELRHRGVMTS
jgi:septum formation protein